MNELLKRVKVTRRRFVVGASAVVAAHSTRGLAQAAQGLTQSPARVGKNNLLAYVGTYTGTRGNGEGIYLFEMDTTNGELTQKKLVAKTPSPSWIVIHPSRKFLYAVNEVNDYQGKSGSVSAFAMNSTTGELTALNTVSSEGAGPAYISLDASGKFALVANYDGGTMAVLPILESGALGAAVDVKKDEGSLGATKATSAPPGSFAISGHDAPHAHMIAPSPDGRWILAVDLGQDRIYIYALDAKTGKLTPNAAMPFATLPSGDGPRHFAFHPSGKWLYSMQEESSTVTTFGWDTTTGELHAEGLTRATPPGFAGTNFASEILVSPSGKTLYSANRLHDTIAIFSIDSEGRLAWQGESPTGGDYPVQCRIDPTGRFFYACNRKSDCISCFRIDQATGQLTPTGEMTGVGSPGSITFLA